YRTPSDEVTPGYPTVLTGSSVGPKSRLELAAWLTQPDHPLTARVMANRIWYYHFGRGLVGSPSDFGRKGESPTHPELVDWLASEFVRRGWSIKSMHRLIMTSAVYRQAVTADADGMKRDPENIWLGRFPRRRLEAEALRDSILAVSGKLNLTMYGPGAKARGLDLIAPGGGRVLQPKEGPQQWRRSMYVFIRRSALPPLLESFDAPPAACSCERRIPTTVPPQALQLLNSP